MAYRRRLAAIGIIIAMGVQSHSVQAAQDGAADETASPPAAEQGLPFDIKDFPMDDDALRALERRHLRLARKSGTVCVHNTSPNGFRFHTGSVTVPLNACNVFVLDTLVAEEKDPALSAFHYAMTPRRRYDQNRPPQYWRIVKKQVQSGRPIPGVGKIDPMNPDEAEKLQAQPIDE